MIGRLKSIGLATLGVLLTATTVLLRMFFLRSQRLEKANEENKAKLKHTQDVMIADKEFEQEHDQRTEQLRDDIEKKKSSSELENPNEW